LVVCEFKALYILLTGNSLAHIMQGVTVLVLVFVWHTIAQGQ